jgi:hypothetical protein
MKSALDKMKSSPLAPCQQSKCAKEYATSLNVMTKVMTSQMKVLLSEKSDSSKEKALERMVKTIADSKESASLMKCSIKNCNDELKVHFEKFIALLKETGKVTKKDVDALKAMIKKKVTSVEDYKKVVYAVFRMVMKHFISELQKNKT